MLRVVEHPSDAYADLRSTLDDLLRQGALTMLQQALEAEVEEYVVRHVAARGTRRHSEGVRKGKVAPRLVTGTGGPDIRLPQSNDRQAGAASEGQRFTSAILPKYVQQAPKVTGLLPMLYLRGLSTGDFQAALPFLLGEGTASLSPAAIAHLAESWAADYEAWRTRSLADTNYVYVWVDGVQFRSRPEADRLCTLVMMGVRPDGTKEIVAVEDGYRESTESWAALLGDLKRRGMSAPVVAVGDSPLGFWTAVGEVWSEAREQRCWVHRLAHGRERRLPEAPRAHLAPAPRRASTRITYEDRRIALPAPSDDDILWRVR